MPLSRIAWLTTVAICLITCVLLLLSGYLGYAGVLLAVALSAAINLRWPQRSRSARRTSTAAGWEWVSAGCAELGRLCDSTPHTPDDRTRIRPGVVTGSGYATR